MPDVEKLYPVAIIQDKYCGLYSRGNWFAIAQADAPYPDFDLEPTRVAFCLENGPNGDDEEAVAFWNSAPPWIAVGKNPDEALSALGRQQ